MGPCLIEGKERRSYFMFNHVEYDSASLHEEYMRDIENGTPIGLPVDYYPDDDPTRPPSNRWRSHAHLLFGNWINEVYQSSPFDLADIGR